MPFASITGSNSNLWASNNIIFLGIYFWESNQCLKFPDFMELSKLLFFADHPPPHFHAIYGKYNALFNLETREIIEGYLPNRATKMVIE